LISPAGYAAAHDLGIPVVQTLHNFRLLCPNALFLRQGRQCEDCLGRSLAWPGIVHACYRGSRPATTVVAAMLGWHRLRSTWREGVDTYITVSQFARAKFIAGGLPADRLVVKPNFLTTDPGVGAHDGRFALYVGRLSEEKGIHTLLRVWDESNPGLPLRVVGGGPLERLLSEAPPGVEWLGWQPRERVLAMMQRATMLVFPTECYEGFPMVILEAMATGLPIVATSLGSLPEILEHRRTGLLIAPRDPQSWAVTLRSAVDYPDELAAMGQAGRRSFELSYTPEAGYSRLMEVYRRTIAATTGNLQPATASV
jgi:glycosyltransferase involved in cell wall biosynthesis